MKKFFNVQSFNVIWLIKGFWTLTNSQCKKERKNHKQEYFRKLCENAFLLEEISEHKKELAEAQKYTLPSVYADEGSMMYKQRNSSMYSH